MIAELEVLPENALALTSKVAIPCCDRPEVMIDRDGDWLVMRCRVCLVWARVQQTQPQLRSRNPLKNRQALLKAMVADLEDLIERWNYRILTGLQMED